MSNTSVTYPAPTPQVEAVERELSRLRCARPELVSRIDRAENILVTQFSVSSHRPISVRIHRDGSRSFAVRSCSRFYRVYTVTEDFRCDCPDSRRSAKPVKPPACKHAIACYVIERVLLRSRFLSPCSGCGERVPNPELTEVQDYHESLAYFEVDMLCRDCLSHSDCW